MYASPSGSVVDPRLTVLSCRLAERGQQGDIAETVDPGSALTLEAAFQVHTALPQTRIDFEVTRSDGLVMFTGSPMVEGAAMLDLKPGMVCSVKIDFRANVLRGIYRVNLRLSERNRLWSPIELSGVSSFVIHETTRVGGCAELEPTYELSIMQPAVAESLPMPH